MEESRKHALLFATTILAARKLATLEHFKLNYQRTVIIRDALSDAEQILKEVETHIKEKEKQTSAG